MYEEEEEEEEEGEERERIIRLQIDRRRSIRLLACNEGKRLGCCHGVRLEEREGVRGCCHGRG